MIEKGDLSNPEITELSVMAKWMMNTGKTSADWDELPVCDVQLMVVDYYASMVLNRTIEENAVRGGMYGRKKEVHY